MLGPTNCFIRARATGPDETAGPECMHEKKITTPQTNEPINFQVYGNGQLNLGSYFFSRAPYAVMNSRGSPWGDTHPNGESGKLQNGDTWKVC